MAGEHLIDTNTVIAYLKPEPVVVQKFAQSSQVYLAEIVLGELYYGAYNSGRAAQNIQVIDNLARTNTLLFSDADTALVYGKIKHDLRAKGRPIPDNDIWIAALAVQHNLTLATRDAHFQAVDGLTAEYW